MGTYYYTKDPSEKGGLYPGKRAVYEDDYIAALRAVAKKRGVNTTDKMILEELDKPCRKSKRKKQ